MKRITIIAFLILAASSTSFAQKFGHVNSNELLGQMPESRDVQKQVEEYVKQLEGQLSTMSEEYQSKVAEYQSNQALWSEPVKESKAEEISSLEKRIQRFQQTAQQSMNQKEEELFEPLLEKVETAIKKVSDEKGYDYVFDTSSGVLLHYPEGDNIMPEVRKELGI